MSTLTASTSLRPEHCIHKLPTSCRLTATAVCCACQDKRQHTPNYQKYIDGIGFVPWGTRQERYCWPCREFWSVRIEVSGMRAADTKIPERPDISQFLTRWYDWHRGYRIIQQNGPDGGEERQAMTGEPLSNTGHGYLPRTLDELRNGLRPGEKEIIERGGQIEQVPEAERPQRDDVELDPAMFGSSDDEHENENGDDSDARQAAPSQDQGTLSVQEAAPAVEHGNLAELAGDMPQTQASSNQTGGSAPTDTNRSAARQGPQQRSRGLGAASEDLARPLRIAQEHYRRVTALRRELQRMRVGTERVMAGLAELNVDVPDSSAAIEQMNRLSGQLSRYREAPLDMPEVQNPDYQSPISSMFERAWRRHNQVQSDRLHALAHQDSPLPIRDASGRLVPPSDPYDALIDARTALGVAGPTQPPPTDGTPQQDQTTSGQNSIPDPMTEDITSAAAATATAAIVAGTPASPAPRFLGLDAPNRPPAIEDDDAFKVDMRCEVCLQQLASVATFPCGHMIMCVWCADEVVPRHPAARNVPLDSRARCPQCRRKVKQVLEVRVRALDGGVVVAHRENES